MAELAVRSGYYFEEFAVGDRVTTPGRTVTEADVVAFAALSGDWNDIHTDAEAAARGKFGERIAHGLLGLSIATGLAARLGFTEGTAMAFMGMEWQFRSPIKIGDTIHAQFEVAELREMRRLGGGMVTFGVQILNQRAETTQRGKWTILIKSKPVSSA